VKSKFLALNLPMKFVLTLALAVVSTVSTMAADALPKVLVICDQIHSTTAKAASSALKGRAEVVTPKRDPGDTGTAIGQLDEILGKNKWDVIHFNFGFADLRHVDPKTKSGRAMSRHAGGVRVTTPEQYEKNLREIVTKLKATGAKLVWASTTPLEGTRHDSLFVSGSEIEYNAIAAKVMAGNGIAFNDMHAWMLANTKEKQRGDPFSFKGIAIHEPVVSSILAALGLPEETKDK
jgi:hypothetical protein